MNPLSPFTYYRRHKRQALLQIGLVMLVTLGLGLLVGVLDALRDSSYTNFSYANCFSMMVSSTTGEIDPIIVSRVRVHPDVERVIQSKILEIARPALFVSNKFQLLGVSEDDTPYLMDLCGTRLKEGRLPQPRTSEFVVSEKVALSLGLHIGDRIGRSINEDDYKSIPTELTLVGILEDDPTVDSGPEVLMGFVSYEYLSSHELYTDRPSKWLVIPRAGRNAAVDQFLEADIPSTQVTMLTLAALSKLTGPIQAVLYTIYGIVDVLVGGAIALVVVAINQIALAQRLSEFGLLQATGRSKSQLIRNITAGTAGVAGLGWLLGLVLLVLALAWLKVNVFEPGGADLNLANGAPLVFTLPIPLAVVISGAWSVWRVFTRLDAVEIIERGKLSMEAGKRRRTARRSSRRSLSPWTFYRRHRRRGVLLVGTMALMILGVAFPVFFLTPMVDAQLPRIAYLRYVSVVSPDVSRTVDPGIAAQIHDHADVARVIPAMALSLAIDVPPVSRTGTTIYAVSEDDMPYVVDALELRLAEGHLPRPRTNEVVISAALARNRSLRVGDAIGHPVYERDSIPVELTIVGLLDPDDTWMGLASLEYLQSHEDAASGAFSLLVAPVAGGKARLDAWLTESVASTQTTIQTYHKRHRDFQQDRYGMLLMFGALEGLIAVTAAVALAILNYIFFSQRREELGVLHALGRSRRWLIWRGGGETASTVAVAWLLGAAVCLLALLYAQAKIYAPKGLSLDFFNPMPWLYTLPVPVAVLAVSAGAITWTLSKLDPVAIIERR
jgi:putative ABC transport system permease protein/lipoprotein-releasing system permease protein